MELCTQAYLAFLKKSSELFTIAVSKRTTEKERPWTNNLGNETFLHPSDRPSIPFLAGHQEGTLPFFSCLTNSLVHEQFTSSS